MGKSVTYTICLMVSILASAGWYFVGDFASGSAFLAAALVLFNFGAGLSDRQHDPRRIENFGPLSRRNALELLTKHGLRAHYYLPAAGQTDEELAAALRMFGDSGYIVTRESTGELVGAVATVATNSDERAKQRRAKLRLID